MPSEGKKWRTVLFRDSGFFSLQVRAQSMMDLLAATRAAWLSSEIESKKWPDPEAESYG
jgi:hypothetical protein